MPMGRPKKHDRHLPPRMRHKHGAYYRVAGGRWEPLGKVYGEALRLWAELEAAPSRVSTIGEAIQAYEIDKVPKLAEATQRDYRRICGVLREVFAEVGIDDLEPTDVAQYLEKRSHAIAGNREIAVLSSVFNYAMRLGHAKANPCRGVARNKERHRTRLPTLQEISAVRLAAPAGFRRIVELALVTALRKGDLVAIQISNLTDRGLEVRTSKRGRPLCFAWSPALREIVDAAKGDRKIGPLFISRRKKAWTTSGIDTAWQKARTKAGITDLHFHDLRAWALTTVDRTKGRKEAQAMAGHAAASTTDVYLRDRSAIDVDPLDLPSSKADA